MTHAGTASPPPAGAGSPVPASLAAPVSARVRRVQAAAALAGHPRRAQLGWSDLAAWPAWADADAAARDALLWRAGAHVQAAALHRCLDGAVHKRLHERLGAAGYAAFVAAAAPPADEAPADIPPDAAALDDLLLAAGRECALAAVPSPLLRVVLRERLWPATLPPVPAMPLAAAQAALRRAAAPHAIAA